MKLSERQFIFTKNVAKFILYIFDKGYTCTLGEVYRTKEQAELYAKKGKGIKNSLHCDRLAIDLNIFSLEGDLYTDDKDYEQFGRYWETMNPLNNWGGRFGDGDHFSMKVDENDQRL